MLWRKSSKEKKRRGEEEKVEKEIGENEASKEGGKREEEGAETEIRIDCMKKSIFSKRKKVQ